MPAAVAAPTADADLVGRGLDAEARERRQVLVERAVVPELGLAAADAAVARLDRVADAAVPAHHAAGVVGDRAAAAHLVEAVAALARSRRRTTRRTGRRRSSAGGSRCRARAASRTPSGRPRPSSCGMRSKASRWTIVPAITSAMGGQPGTLMIGLPEMILWIGVAPVGFGLGGLDAAVGGAAAPGDDRLGARGGLLHDVQRGAPADAAVDAVVGRRHRALDQHQVLALVLLHRVVQGLLGLRARPRPAASRCSRARSCRA